MEVRKNLELVNVSYENGGQKAVMTFLDKERGEVRVVNFNKQIYKDKKYINDTDKAAKVEGWCADVFGCDFTELPTKVGQKYDVYEYPDFNAVFECDYVEKFTEDMVGQIYQTTIDKVILGDYEIQIRYTIDGNQYATHHRFSQYVESLNQYFVDPQKKEKVFAKFQTKYGVSVEDRDKLVGHKIMVEVKNAFGGHYWGDIKKFPAGRK